MKAEELTPIHFLAQMINQEQSISAGYTAPTRWLCTREDLRQEYLEKAKKMHQEWVDEEIKAKQSRDSFKYNIYE